MGLAEIFLGKDNPFTQWAGQNQNFLGALGAGLGQGQNIQGGLSAGLAQMPQAKALDYQAQQQRTADAKVMAQENATKTWLEQNYPQYAHLPPADGFKLAMQAEQQKYTGAAGGSESFYGNIVPMSDEQGNVVLGQASNRGRWQPLQGAEGFAPAPTTKQMDTGTEIITTDIYGNELFRTPKQNFEEASDKAQGTVVGRETGERQMQAPIAQAAVEQANAKSDNIVNTIDEAVALAGSGETGLVGSVMGGVAGTKAYDLRAAITTIKANLGFAELQAMRDASPTGGALGQVAVQELEALQSTIANLDPNQSEEQIKQNLALVRELLLRQKMYRQMALEAKYGSAPAPAPAAASGSGGYTVLSVE